MQRRRRLRVAHVPRAVSCAQCLDTPVRLGVFVVWMLAAYPLRWLEQLVLASPIRFIRWQLQQDAHAQLASFVYGILLSYGVFLPLSRLQVVSLGLVCTTYLSVIAWCMGHALVAWLIFLGLDVCIELQHAPPGLHCCGVWKHSPGRESNLALALGLSFAFPVASIRLQDPTLETPSLHEWCRPSPQWPAEAVYVPVMFLALIAACVVPPTADTSTQEQEDEDDYNSLPVAISDTDILMTDMRRENE